MTHLLGLDALIRKAACDRLTAQSQIARIRDGQIAHHAPSAPVLFDASLCPDANAAALMKHFPRATIVTEPPEEGCDLAFAAFGLALSPAAFSSALRPHGAFVVAGTHDLGSLQMALKATGLTVTARTHLAGFGKSLAGVKPVAVRPDSA